MNASLALPGVLLIIIAVVVMVFFARKIKRDKRVGNFRRPLNDIDLNVSRFIAIALAIAVATIGVSLIAISIASNLLDG